MAVFSPPHAGQKGDRVSRRSARVCLPSELPAEQRAVWTRLCTEEPAFASPFLTPDYAECASLAGHDVRVCVVSEDAHAAAFLAFQYAGAASRLLRAAERVGGEMTDYCGVVAVPDFRIAPAELLRFAGIHSFYFTHLDETQLAVGLTGEQPEAGLRIRIDGGAEVFRAALLDRRRRFVAETARLQRRLEESRGPFRFVLEEREWEAPLRWLVERKRAQYARTGRPDPLADDRSIALLRHLAASTSPLCRGVVSTLYAGETWVSSHFGLRNRDTLHYWFPVYNHELGRIPSGHFLMLQIISAADAAGIRCIDRGAGDTEAKRLLANDEHRYYRGLWSRSGPWSLAWRLCCSLRWRWEAQWHEA